MAHDQTFKTLLRGYFYDFLTLFFPEVARRIDPEDITFMDATDFTNQPEGDLRIADLAARVRSLEGLREVVIVHTEVESEPGAAFGYRMWEYNALLALREKQPVISIALFPFVAGNGIELARYTETILGQDYIKLEYWRIPLRGLRAEDYLEAEPLLGAVLASLMRPEAGSKVDLKVAIFARFRQGEMAPGTRALFFNFVQSYLRLSDEEYAEFGRRLAPEGDVTMETLEQTWLDEQIERGIAEHAPWADKLVERGIERGIEQGIERGMAQGMLQAKRETVLRLIRVRFSDVPAGLAERLAHLDEPDLDRLIDRVVVVATRDELLAGL
jgi:hypothetical protein